MLLIQRGRLRNLGENIHGLKFTDLTLELIFNWSWYTSGVFEMDFPSQAVDCAVEFRAAHWVYHRLMVELEFGVRLVGYCAGNSGIVLVILL